MPEPLSTDEVRHSTSPSLSDSADYLQVLHSPHRPSRFRYDCSEALCHSHPEALLVPIVVRYSFFTFSNSRHPPRCILSEPPESCSDLSVVIDPKEHADPAAPPSLLIRVTNGATSNDKGGPAPHLVKISTVVAGKDIDNFFVRYADVWKGGMGALKKRDRRKKKKVKKTTATPAVTVAA